MTVQESTGTISDRSTEAQTQVRASEKSVTSTPGLRTQTETPGGQRATVKVAPAMQITCEFEITGAVS